MVTMEQLVLQNHLVRNIRDEVAYLFAIKSERQLVKEIEVNVFYRWLLRMSLTEKVIHASTLN